LNHMVERHPEALDTVFRALADSSRRDMLRRLGDDERSIGELAAPYDMSFAAASKHVRVLEHAGLVERRIEGRRHLCRLVPARLAEAHEWLSFYQRFWAHRLDALADALAPEAKPSKPRKRKR
jgi:DNA-binding transcriptional ArsR family regulator